MLSIAALAAAWTGSAAAAPGDLDSSFGTGGVVLTGLQPTSPPVAAVQPDGKIVVAASLADFASASSVFAVLRYLPNGALDAAFGTGGVVRTSFTIGFNVPTAVAVMADGKIVVAGTASNATNATRAVAVARYDGVTGALDGAFGSGGKLTLTWLGYSDTPSAILQQPDGMILVGGGARACFGYSCVTSSALARLNPDGTLDASFGQGGQVIADLVGAVSSVALTPEGGILVAGATGTGTPGVTRFATAGSVETLPAGEILGAAGGGTVVFQPDGKVVQATYTPDRSERDVDVKVQRFTADGALDPTFASPLVDFVPDDGLFVESVGQALLVDPSRRVLVAGYAEPSPAATSFGLARLNEDGTLDASFGQGGAVSTAFPGYAAQATALALQPDGGIVAAGWALQAASTSIALARYLGSDSQVAAAQ